MPHLTRRDLIASGLLAGIAWDYHQGESERRLGAALKGHRDQAFVMTKLGGRTKDIEPAKEGQFEEFKTRHVHDSTMQHPEWLGLRS